MKPWTRLLWGIEFTDTDGKTILIGSMWHDAVFAQTRPYPGEPTRALVFQTRRDARDWCAGINQQWRRRPDFVRKWRVRPVRVRETVRVA